MKRLRKFGVVAGMIAAFAAVSVMAAEVTVGQFVVEIAKVKNINASDPASAVRALQAVGVDLSRLDLTKGLTEGDVARISNAVGVRVTTSRPDAAVSQRQVENYVETFGSDLNRLPDSDQGVTSHTGHNSKTKVKSNSKNKSKSKGQSPTDPV